MNCKRCKTALKDGIALEENTSGVSDFIGDDEVCTVSPDGTAYMIPCLKCPKCGTSYKLKEAGE